MEGAGSSSSLQAPLNRLVLLPRLCIAFSPEQRLVFTGAGDCLEVYAVKTHAPQSALLTRLPVFWKDSSPVTFIEVIVSSDREDVYLVIVGGNNAAIVSLSELTDRRFHRLPTERVSSFGEHIVRTDTVSRNGDSFTVSLLFRSGRTCMATFVICDELNKLVLKEANHYPGPKCGTIIAALGLRGESACKKEAGDGKENLLFLAGSAMGDVYLWQSEDAEKEGYPRPEPAKCGFVLGLTLTSHPNVFSVITEDRAVNIWQISREDRSVRSLAKVEGAHSTRPSAIAHSKTFDVFVTAAEDGELIVWRVELTKREENENGEEERRQRLLLIKRLQTRGGPVRSLAINNYDDMVYYGSAGGSLCGVPLESLLRSNPPAYDCLCHPSTNLVIQSRRCEDQSRQGNNDKTIREMNKVPEMDEPSLSFKAPPIRSFAVRKRNNEIDDLVCIGEDGSLFVIDNREGLFKEVAGSGSFQMLGIEGGFCRNTEIVVSFKDRKVALFVKNSRHPVLMTLSKRIVGAVVDGAYFCLQAVDGTVAVMNFRKSVFFSLQVEMPVSGRGEKKGHTPIISAMFCSLSVERVGEYRKTKGMCFFGTSTGKIYYVRIGGSSGCRVLFANTLIGRTTGGEAIFSMEHAERVIQGTRFEDLIETTLNIAPRLDVVQLMQLPSLRHTSITAFSLLPFGSFPRPLHEGGFDSENELDFPQVRPADCVREGGERGDSHAVSALAKNGTIIFLESSQSDGIFTVSQREVDIGRESRVEWPVFFRQSRTREYIAGFTSTSFLLVDRRSMRTLSSVQCGGGNRPWTLTPEIEESEVRKATLHYIQNGVLLCQRMLNDWEGAVDLVEAAHRDKVVFCSSLLFSRTLAVVTGSTSGEIVVWGGCRSPERGSLERRHFALAPEVTSCAVSFYNSHNDTKQMAAILIGGSKGELYMAEWLIERDEDFYLTNGPHDGPDFTDRLENAERLVLKSVKSGNSARVVDVSLLTSKFAAVALADASISLLRLPSAVNSIPSAYKMLDLQDVKRRSLFSKVLWIRLDCRTSSLVVASSTAGIMYFWELKHTRLCEEESEISSLSILHTFELFLESCATTALSYFAVRFSRMAFFAVGTDSGSVAVVGCPGEEGAAPSILALTTFLHSAQVTAVNAPMESAGDDQFILSVGMDCRLILQSFNHRDRTLQQLAAVSFSVNDPSSVVSLGVYDRSHLPLAFEEREDVGEWLDVLVSGAGMEQLKIFFSSSVFASHSISHDA